MYITLNTNKFASQNYNQYKKNENKQPNFGANVHIPKKSDFLNPLKRISNATTDFIMEHYTAPLYRSGFTKFIKENTEKFDGVVGHMQVIGSIIVTGMYMALTLKNQNLDNEKKKTLSVNQFLTFAVATLMGYTIDKKLDEKWEHLTRKYALKILPKDKLDENETIKTLDEKLKLWNIENEKAFNLKKELGEINKNAKFRPNGIADYAEKVLKVNKTLQKYLVGMGYLKKLLVFGTIYRFISPVAVTPVANWIGNKYIYKNQNERKA